MRRMQTLRLHAVLAFVLSGLVPHLAAAAESAEPLVLDLSKFQREKFLTDGKTNQYWQTVYGRQVFDGLPFQIEGRGCVYGTKMGADRGQRTDSRPPLILSDP